MKSLRLFYQKMNHEELDSTQAFREFEMVLKDVFCTIHFSIFNHDKKTGVITSLYSSSDGVYGQGDRLTIINKIWLNSVMINGILFSTNDKLVIYDTFIKGFDFIVLGAEALISIPIKHQCKIVGVVILTFSRHIVSSFEIKRIEEIILRVKPYIFDAKAEFKWTLPGLNIDQGCL